jgi:4-methyl-5(b-hydroxyethyl)-thiazole monophosphate biosynthesis
MKRVLILLSNGFEIYEAAAFVDVLGWAGSFGSERIETVTAGTRHRLTSTFGLQIVPDASTSAVEAASFDALALPGGFEAAGFYEDAYSEGFLDIIRQFDALKKPIAAVCVAALPLAKSGVIRGRRATTYRLLGGKRVKELAAMGVEVIDSQIVRDGHIITSTAPATAVDVAFALLAELTSGENARHIRRMMGFSTDDHD